MRYVTDVSYVATFIPELSPEWLDLVAAVNGLGERRRSSGSRWCELGCGRGLTVVVLAAGRPDAEFVGIDLMPEHVAAAERLAGAAGVGNAAFHALDFEAAAEEGPSFDYIVAHGVYAWIDERAQQALWRFVERRLAPGGLVYVSYNAMPGWAADLPVQHLIQALASHRTEASDARFAALAPDLQALTRAGAATLAASPVAQRLLESGGDLPVAYLAHEYLAPAWRPRYVTEVRAAAARAGLQPVGSATLADNFDGLTLRRSARDALAGISDPNLRELVRDYFIHQRFRRDVFGKAVQTISADERRRRLLEMTVALTRPGEDVGYAMPSAAGEVRFDSPVARGIVASLQSGPKRAGDCREGVVSDGALLSSMLTLCSAGVVSTAIDRAPDFDRLNRALAAESIGSDDPPYRVQPSGMAIRPPRAAAGAAQA